jgi:serine/threonine-protein phosphatase 2A regulatory subunit A
MIKLIPLVPEQDLF